MPEITNHGKPFFIKTIAAWSLTEAAGFGAPGNGVPSFNRPGNNRAQIRAEDRTSGRGR
jgi:hypothetical protein